MLPPSNIPAEEAALAVILFDPHVLDFIEERLPADAFHLTKHQNLYKQCLALHRRGSLDMYNLAVQLNPQDPQAVLPELSLMVERVIGAGDIDQHVASILETWRRRRLLALGTNLIAQAQNPALELQEIQVALESELTDICQDNTKSQLVSLHEAVEEFKIKLHEPHNAIPLQIPALDRLLSGGLRPQTFTVIAARPAMGKTWLGSFVARAIAGIGTGYPAVIFTAEMSRESLASRFLATESNIALNAIMERRLDDKELETLLRTFFDKIPIYIDDTVGSALTMGHIESQCQQVRRRHGGVGVVVIDYIQLLGDRGAGNRAGEVGRYSGGLNDLSKKLNCPTVALAQLNRGVESRNNKRPIISDLKESGDIEQDATSVILLYREDYYADDKTAPIGASETVDLELILAKNRNGPCGTAVVQFCPSTGAITSEVPVYSY